MFCKLARILVWSMLPAIGWIMSIPPVSATAQELQVLWSDDFGATLEFKAPLPGNLRGSSEGSLRPAPIDGLPRAVHGRCPELPVKGMLLQVPQSGRISLDILVNSSQQIPAGMIHSAVHPGSSMEQDDSHFEGNSDDRLPLKCIPEDVAELGPRSMLRGIHVARLLIHPVQFNPRTRELRWSERVVLRVSFEKPLPPFIPHDSRQFERDPEIGFKALLRQSIRNFRGLSQPGPENWTSEQPQEAQALTRVEPDRSLKIELKQEGVYHINYSNLLKAGVPIAQIDLKTLKVFNRGNQIAIESFPKTHLGKGVYIQFYAEPFSSAFTDTNVYWLSWGGLPGKRISAVNGLTTGAASRAQAFYSKLHFEENHAAWDYMPGSPDQDFWFWERFTAPMSRTYSLTVPNPVSNATSANMRIAFRGRSTVSPHPNHHARILLNDTHIGDAIWDNDLEHIQDIPFSAQLLKPGANDLTVEAPLDAGASIDLFYLNWVEIGYLRGLVAVGDELTFSLESQGRLQIDVEGFSGPKVIVYDVSDPNNVKAVKGIRVTPSRQGYKATFKDTFYGTRKYRIQSQSSFKKPDRLELSTSKNLKSTGKAADYLLITARDFLPSVDPLCVFRRNQGLRVQAVAVEDIYNEFNYGLVDPQAIKDFLYYAYMNWQRPAPTYVFLLGDSNSDYRDYIGTGKKNVVPVHLSWTEGQGVTPDDNWYVALEGADVLPEMMIGRASSSNADMAAQVVRKILSYEQSSHVPARRALFVADNDPYFEGVNNELMQFLPSGYETLRVNLASYPNTDAATAEIVVNINQGALLTNYVGHGAVTQWAAERLFELSDIDALTNIDMLTFVVSLNCLNGYFSWPYSYSLGDAWVVAPKGGAIASFSPSGLVTVLEHEILGRNIFSSIFSEGNRAFGVITTKSKIDAFASGGSEDLVRVYTLFGDPAGQLRVGN